MIFTEEKERYIVVAANAAPYEAYGIIDTEGEFIEDLILAQTTLNTIAEISDWYELAIHNQIYIIWLSEDVFADPFTRIAWEEYGNGTFAYANISEEEMARFMEHGLSHKDMEICSLNLTSHNTFYFNAQVFNEKTNRRETFISRHMEIDQILQSYQDDNGEFGLL